MYKKKKAIINCILVISLCAQCFCSGGVTILQATPVSDMEQQLQQHQAQLDALLNKVASLEDKQDILLEQIDDLNAEIINTMTTIGLMEDEIALKEEAIAEKEIEIAAKEDEITAKQFDIDLMKLEYDKAVEHENDQRAAMIKATRLMYEAGGKEYMDLILAGMGIGELLNRLDYIEKVYEYSKAKLDAYVGAAAEVKQLGENLQQEKAVLETDVKELEKDKASLEEDKDFLETDRADMEEMKKDLNVQLEKKKKESKNFAAELSKAKQDAAAAKTLIQQDKIRLEQLQAAENAANSTYPPTEYSIVIDNAVGSELGKQIARYACQYIGNPYVYGGTSLTNGADCSGFTYRIYMNFGFSIPRNSARQRTAGKAVSYADAQPGDLICYDGHVGMYIGNGLIVHASNERDGIKVSRAQYRPILAVRRIV